MWLIVAASDTQDRVRVAAFTNIELAKDYLSKARVGMPGKIFKDGTLLAGYAWAGIVYEQGIPVDPVL